MATSIFVEMAKEVWEDRWDYSKTQLVAGEGRKVTITCPLHGDFVQNIYNHLNGHVGCKACDPRTDLDKMYRTFIFRAIEVHSNKYTYVRESYKGVRIPITIICPEHGPFQETPYRHVHYRKGCPKCPKPIRGTPKGVKKVAQVTIGDNVTVEELGLIIEVIRERLNRQSQPA